MIPFLRLAAAFVLVAMFAVTSWASLQVPLWKTPREVLTHPWFIATLFDTYFAFLTFYVWLAYKETRTSPASSGSSPSSCSATSRWRFTCSANSSACRRMRR